MKRVYVFLCLALSFVLSVSCSSDDDESDKFVVPVTPGIDLQEDEVQLVYHATPDSYYEIAFSVESQSDEIMINWGDDDRMHILSEGKAVHVYPAEERSYIITIMSEGISKIDITDSRAMNITAFYAGNCPNLMNLSYNKNNRFEAFDLTMCPHFNAISMQVNNSGFDLSGLKKAKWLWLSLTADQHVDLKGFDVLEKAYIYLDVNTYWGNNTVRITESPELRSLSINMFTPSGYAYPPYTIYLEDLEIKAPRLNDIRLENLYIPLDIDLREAGKDSVQVVMYSCNTPEKLLFSPATYSLSIHNGWSPATIWQVEELDLSGCERLTYLFLDVLSHLKTIRLGNATNLRRFWLQKCPQMERLDFASLPSLCIIECFTNERLKEITLKDLPELHTMDFTNNSVLSELTGEELPMLSRIDISNNQFSENTIISLINALPDEPAFGGQNRTLDIEGNPGDTEEVHNFIENKQYWEFKSYHTQNASPRAAGKTDIPATSTDTGNIIHLNAKR